MVECKENNSLLTEEIFGTVFAIIHAKGDKKLLRLVNNIEYSLFSCIVSSYEKRADRIVMDIDAGSVFINKYWEP